MPEISKEEIPHLFRWLIIVRILGTAAVGTGLAVFWYAGIISFSPRPFLFILLPVYLFFNILWFIAARFKLFAKLLLYLQLAVDLLTITAGIYLSGGIHSEFVFIYLWVNVTAAFISSRATTAVAFASMLLYGTLIAAEHFSWITPIYGVHAGLKSDEIVRMGVYVLTAAIISFETYYYISNIRKKDTELLKLKDDFLFRAAHDLRNPALSVKWIAEKYLRKGEWPRDENFKKNMELVRESSGRILGFLHDIVEIARGEGVETKREKIDLSSVIKSVVRELEPEIVKRSVKISYVPEKPVLILGDARALKEVFGNLMDNAVKYNKIGGEIIIAHQKENGFIKTTISDSGKGIRPEDLPKLFTPYFRSDADKDIGGTGLGLFLAKKLLENMDGKINVGSVRGKGTTAAVHLPRAENGA